MAEGAIGISASKLSEAAVFADAGIKDIQMVHPFYGDHKLTILKNLLAKAEVSCVVDSIEQAEGISQVGQAVGRKHCWYDLRWREKRMLTESCNSYKSSYRKCLACAGIGLSDSEGIVNEDAMISLQHIGAISKATEAMDRRIIELLQDIPL